MPRRSKRKLSEAEYKKIIGQLLDKGYSANRIQKYLQRKGVGIRRKRLLAMVREVKKTRGVIRVERPKKRRKKRKKRKRRGRPGELGVQYYKEWFINILVWTLRFSRGKKGKRQTVTIDMRLGCYAQRNVIRELSRKMQSLYYEYDLHKLKPWDLTKAEEFRKVSEAEAQEGTKYPYAEFKMTSSDGYFNEDYIVRC